jgi:hypothetical protein
MANELTTARNTKVAVPVPEHLQVENPESLDALKQYIRPNRVKIIQDQTDAEIKAATGPAGTVCLMPSQEVINPIVYTNNMPDEEATPPFFFTPIFLFTEFLCINPYKLKDTLPAIRSRSFDANSEEAQRARDFDNREMLCPENPDYKCTFVESLNFAVMINGQEELSVMSFQKGEFKTGLKFVQLIKARGKVEIFANIFAGHTALHSNKSDSWWGIDPANPHPDDSDPWVASEPYGIFQDMHADLKEKHANALIQVNYEDERPTEAVSPEADTM